jgi:hypothetical protein
MAKKAAKKAKARRRKPQKGIDIRGLRREAEARIKKLEANIKKRDKAIASAQKRGDKETVKTHRKMKTNARTMVRGLKGVVRAMRTDVCPFSGQIDPTMS